MSTIVIAALAVGGATIFGGVLGLFFRCGSKRVFDAFLSLAAGVMLSASMMGLIFPSLEYAGSMPVLRCVIGILVGALCVNLLDLIPVHCIDPKDSLSFERGRRVFLFVCAIALHNLPEGIAAGVGFGGEDVRSGILIATAIALQNIPEGLIVSASMLSVGVPCGRAFVIASLTGVIEILGSFIGYFAAGISTLALPFILAFAGGTMLYVISEEMIPETHSEENGRLSTWFLLIGFSLILLLGAII